MNPDVNDKFESYPRHIRPKLEVLRSLIFEVAANTPTAGKLEETLKWGEPSYLTSESKSGTTIRIDWKSKTPDQYAMYFNCKTTLVEDCRSLFGDTLSFGGNRAILFNVANPLPENEVRACIGMALTYHLDKKLLHSR